MVTLMCPYCDEDIKLESPFTKLLEDIICPHCKKISDLNYEENDGDNDYFYLEKQKRTN